MEKKNYILLTIIAIAVLLVSVIGATFAYFASTTTITATSALEAATSASAAVFSSSSTNGISLTVTTADMQQAAGGSGVVAATDEGDLTVTLTADEGTVCTYNISYTHDSSESAYTPTVGYENQEFLVSGSSNKVGETKSLSATRYDQLTGNVITGATITAGTSTTTVTWTFTATIYNLGVNQFAALGNKTFKGSFKVSTVKC
ncbi:MAG: hypothetical protein GX951_00730 [Mollicutes bacterium]|nr:hypothetical protein [Mollicutes bacterium]